MGNTILDENQASTSLLPVSNISLHDLFEKINSNDKEFLKYVPDGFLNDAQEQVKAESLPQLPAADDVSSVAESPRQQSSALSPLGNGRDAAPQWAVDLIKTLSTIDSAFNMINYSLSGKTEQGENKSDVDRMVKLLSIASGKTTAEQEAEAGDIPYSRYIKEKESATQKENTAENSGEVDINNLPTIVLSEKSELAEKIKSSSESKYKVIRDFIFDIFGNKKIKLSDGLNAIIEKRDAQHIAHQADNKKTAEIAQLEKIIKMAVKLSEEKNVVHKKFDYFAYYGINVEFQGKRFALFLNVGRAKNGGSYHIYDITDWSKKRDIANHDGGLARPVGNALTNDVSNDSIHQNETTVNTKSMQIGDENTSSEDNLNGFTKVDVSEDGVTYESRLLHTMRGEKISTEGQAYIKKICKNLGVDVVFENVYTPKGKHADGYIDSNGVIHLDYHCSNPVEFVLKHELTHYGESSALYSNFCKAVISSEAFAQWINSKVKGDDNVTVKAAEYREQISRLYKRNGVKLNPARQQSEMIANFVGEVLFSADTNGLERLTTNMTVKEKRSVIDYIKGFIAHIKEKLKKVKGVSSEIVELERKFNEIISTAEQNKTADNSPNYSIAKDESGHYVKIDISQDLFDNKTIREQQDIAKKIIKSNFKGKVLKVGVDGSAYINKRSAEEYAYPANRRMELDVKESKMRAAPELENLLAVSKFVRNLPDDGRHPDATKGWDIYLTRFKIGKSMFKGEVKIKVTNRGYIFYDITQIEKLPVNSGQTVMNTAAASGSPSTDIIDDNSSYVNSNYMQEAEKYSIDPEENISESSESTNPESFSIPNETVKDVSDAEAVKENKYSYKSLINKPDMEITIVDDSVEYTPNAENRKNVVNEAIKNAASVGRTNENGNAVVYVKDIDTEVVVSKNGLRHGLDRRFEVVAPVTLEVGEILTHSIRINELIPKNENVSKSYVLIGAAKNIKNEPYIVSFVINRATNEISSIDVLYSVNTKTEPVGSLSPSGFMNNTSYFTDSNISISDLLDLVNKYFPDILPEDVLRHYGYTSRPDGEIGKSALYSIDMEAADESDITEIPDLMAVVADRYKRGELSDEEYRIEVQDLLMRANEKFGVIETGELAENKTQIPKRVTSDESSKTKRWVRTVHESGILPEDIEIELDAKILKDAMSYQIIDNKVAQRQANAAIQRGTAVKEWEAAVNGEGRVGKREIAIGETLLKLAAERNDTKEVMKLIAEVSEMGTRAGQIVQAMSMLKRMDGIGQLYYVKKSVDRINRDLDKRFAKKQKKGKLGTIPQVKINETLANQLAESKTQQDFEVTYEAMMQSIAEQVPSTFLDKWNAWRYFAMLFNPRTHIRNFLGNYGFVPAVRFKDMLSATAEKMFVGEEQRTKSVVVKKEYREFALKDFSEVEEIITGGGKLNPSDDIRDRQNIFETKWLEKLRKWNFDLLEKEDAIFLKKHYSHALGGFLQARGIDISKDIDSAVMEEARKYAMQEAQKATYRDASKAATVISNFTSRGGIAGNLVEGILPFKKTPINIVKRGIEYSPIGLIKVLTKGTYDLANKNITASQYIDGIAGGLTGTGIVVLGALLSSLGFIKITGGFDDDEEDDINRLLGKQEYAIEIGGASYTIDWMAPVCIPFFMGVEIQKALEENGNENVWQSFKNVTGNALEPIINLSMLSGMQDVISSAKYSEGSAVVGSVLWNIALSYGSQALPSISGAVARTVDGKRRTTYIDKTSWVSDMGQMAINKLESKIPLASMLRSEYVDEFGRTEESGNVFMRAIQNLFSPGYYSKIEEDPVIEQLKELYEETGESVLPTKPKKYIDVNGERIHLRAEEYEEYAKFVGQARYEYLEEFFESSESKRLTADEKREVISDLYSYALAKGKTQYSDYELPKLYVKVYDAEANGISPIDYYNSKIATNVDNADTDGSGSVTKSEKIAAIKKMDLPTDIKAALIALYK